MLYPKSLAAVFTRVKNEKYMLPIWLRYYSKFFASRDMYVLDNDTTDGSTDVGGFQRIPIHNSRTWDDPWLTSMVCRTQRELLRHYRLVLYTDVDEFIVPDPRYYRNLLHYLEVFNRDFIQTTSYTVCHNFKHEPAIDLSKPILAQRSLWSSLGGGWGKTALSRVPLDWGSGQHDCHQNPQSETDFNLYLVHLPLIDVAMCQQRRADRIGTWPIGNLKGKHVLDTTMSGIEGHVNYLLSWSKPIPEFIRAVEI